MAQLAIVCQPVPSRPPAATFVTKDSVDAQDTPVAETEHIVDKSASNVCGGANLRSALLHVRRLPSPSQAIKPDGGWLVFDMRGGATPADNLSDPQLQAQAPVLYGFSVHVCLPSGAS